MFLLRNFTIGIYKKHKSNYHLFVLVIFLNDAILISKVHESGLLIIFFILGMYVLYHSLIVIVLKTQFLGYFLETGNHCVVTKIVQNLLFVYFFCPENSGAGSR